jgi:hypothetical protein
MLWIRKILVRIRILQKFFNFFYFFGVILLIRIGIRIRIRIRNRIRIQGNQIRIREAQKHQTIQIRIHNTAKKVTKVWTFCSYLVHKKLPESTSVSPSACLAGGST